MTVTPTKAPRLRFLAPIREAYLRYLLKNAEQDAEHAEKQARVFRHHAQALRVELSRLGGL